MTWLWTEKIPPKSADTFLEWIKTQFFSIHKQETINETKNTFAVTSKIWSCEKQIDPEVEVLDRQAKMGIGDIIGNKIFKVFEQGRIRPKGESCIISGKSLQHKS